MNYLFLQLAILVALSACQKPSRELNLETTANAKRYTYIQMGDQSKKVYYDVRGAHALVEGDILLGTVQDVEAARTQFENGNTRGAIALSNKKSRWSNNTVPFVIAKDFPNEERITRAIEHIQDNTPIKFVKRDKQADYLYFTNESSGCFSSVGKKGGKQTLNLESNCNAGNTVHEILHALGFWHEQSRSDRDKFVQIHWDNIKEDDKHNFNQELNDSTDLGDYNFGSIMHYGAFAFSTNGKATITKLDGSTDGFGSRTGLSEGDVAAIKALYPD